MNITAQSINDTLESNGIETSGALYDGLNVYFEDDTIEIVIKNSALYGRVHEVGVHCNATTMADVLNSLAQAERNMFPKVFVYVNHDSHLRLVK